MNSTINRGWLRKQVEAGKMEGSSCFSHDAMYDSIEMVTENGDRQE